MTIKTALLATLVLATAACEKGGESTNPPADGGDVTDPAGDGATTSDAEASGETKAPPGAPDVKWADKTTQQRKEWMGIEVLPEDEDGLQGAYDEAQVAKGFGCDTCHGEDGKERNGYKMPTDAIYPLPKDDPVKAAMEYDEKVTKFMVEQHRARHGGPARHGAL